MDFRTAVAARQLSERSEWAVNAVGAVMLSVPHCMPSDPVSISVKGSACKVDYESASFEIPVPALILPFLKASATVLLVTFRRTNIVIEKDVFVRHLEP
jgi:hypothetical protein